MIKSEWVHRQANEDKSFDGQILNDTLLFRKTGRLHGTGKERVVNEIIEYALCCHNRHAGISQAILSGTFQEKYIDLIFILW